MMHTPTAQAVCSMCRQAWPCKAELLKREVLVVRALYVRA